MSHFSRCFQHLLLVDFQNFHRDVSLWISAFIVLYLQFIELPRYVDYSFLNVESFHDYFLNIFSIPFPPLLLLFLLCRADALDGIPCLSKALFTFFLILFSLGLLISTAPSSSL